MKRTDINYWYNEVDINLLLKEKSNKDYKVIEAATPDLLQLTQRIDQACNKLEKNLQLNSTVIPINLGTSDQGTWQGLHWVGLVIKKIENTLVAFYNDSFGTRMEQSLPELKQILINHGLTENNIIDLRKSQQINGYDCGPWTVLNLDNLARNGVLLEKIDNTTIINQRKTLEILAEERLTAVRHIEIIPDVIQKKDVTEEKKKEKTISKLPEQKEKQPTQNKQTIDKYKQSLLAAIEENDIDLVTVFLNKVPDLNIEDISNDGFIITALKKGNVDIAKLLLKHPNQSYLKEIVEKEYPKIELFVKELNGSQNWPQIANKTLREAIKIGKPEVVKLLLNNGAKAVGNALIEAIQSENLDIINLMIETLKQSSIWPTIANTALSTTVKIGNTEIVKLLLNEKAVPNNKSLREAVKIKNLEIIELLLANEAKAVGTTMLEAVKSQDLKVIELITSKLEVNSSWLTIANNAFLEAVKRGNPAIVDFLLKKGATIDGNTLVEAVKSNNLATVNLIVNVSNKGLGWQEKVDNALLEAVIIGETKIVQLLLDIGANTNACEPNMVGQVFGATRPNSALILAIQNGNFGVASLLIDKGASLNFEGAYKWTPISFLFNASYSKINDDLVPLANKLIKEEYVPSFLIIQATKSGDLDKLTSFIKMCEQNPILYNKEKALNDALSEAIKRGNLAIADLLLKKGAKLDGNTLVEAVKSNSLETVDLIIKVSNKELGWQEKANAALLEAIKNSNLTIIESLIDNGATSNNESLIAAIRKGNVKIVELLLKKGATVDGNTLVETVKSNSLETVDLIIKVSNKELGWQEKVNAALLEALKSWNVKVETIELLVGNGAIPNNESLITAIRKGNPQIVKLLLNKETKIGENALMEAAKSNSLETLNLIIEASDKELGWQEKTSAALIEVLKSWNVKVEIVELLVSNGAIPNNESLMTAIRKGNPQIVKLLLNKETKIGENALVEAVKSNSLETVNLIIEASEKGLEWQEKVNISLLEAVRSNKKIEVVKLLLNNGANINAETDLGETAQMLTHDRDIIKLLNEQTQFDREQIENIMEDNIPLLGITYQIVVEDFPF